MSSPVGSPTKSTLTSWLKNLKGTTSPSDEHLPVAGPPPRPDGSSPQDAASNGTGRRDSAASTQLAAPAQQKTPSQSIQGALDASTSASSSSSSSRPKMNYKSHSLHSFRPLSSYFGSSPSSSSSSQAAQQQQLLQQQQLQHPDIRKQRDDFIAQRQLDSMGSSPVFGVPLEESVKIAEGKIYISSDDEGLVVYGCIPRVVASCGLFLKKNALDTEGIFRVAGSSKRIKQLQIIFSTPPDFGAKVDWDCFTVHDAASLLRRYLGALPEPLVPYALYEDFREPLRSRPAILKYLKDREKKMSNITDDRQPSEETEIASTAAASAAPTEAVAEVHSDEEKKQRKKQRKQQLIKERREALKEYAALFDRLPDLQRQLLFYILDLLAIFNMHSDQNRMPAKNLAAIFQPSILSHSDHDMSVEDYALSSLVIEFMIEYSHKILPAAQESVRLAAIAAKQKQQQQQQVDPSQSLPPTSTGPKTRKHSKSLSSVQNPSDSIRATSSRANLAKYNNHSIDDLSEDEPQLKQQAGSVSAEYRLDRPPPISIDDGPVPNLPPSSSGSPKGTSMSPPQSPTHSFLHSLAKPLNKLSPRLRSQTVSSNDISTQHL